MEERKLDRGVRISSENFAAYEKIETFPLYAVTNVINLN
jgi:hypothetical protein